MHGACAASQGDYSRQTRHPLSEKFKKPLRNSGVRGGRWSTQPDVDTSLNLMLEFS